MKFKIFARRNKINFDNNWMWILFSLNFRTTLRMLKIVNIRSQTLFESHEFSHRERSKFHSVESFETNNFALISLFVVHFLSCVKIKFMRNWIIEKSEKLSKTLLNHLNAEWISFYFPSANWTAGRKKLLIHIEKADCVAVQRKLL